MTLYLPEHVAEAERQRFEAAILRNVTVEDQRARDFTEVLQQINPDLFMVKAKDEIEAGLPLRAGFYHVLKRNHGAPMTVATVHENDRYVEPDSRVFERLAAGNMTQRRVMDTIAEQDRIVERAVAAENERARDERHAELRDRANAAWRTSVSLDRTRPWTQNEHGRRAR